jgi:hypothetical protein
MCCLQVYYVHTSVSFLRELDSDTSLNLMVPWVVLVIANHSKIILTKGLPHGNPRPTFST